MAAGRPPVVLGRAVERQTFDRLLEDLRRGRSAVLVVRGEQGAGKTALLGHCARQASAVRVAHVAGVEAEVELPFAALHQLCAPVLGHAEALPARQLSALRVAFGLAFGDVPDRWTLVGAAIVIASGLYLLYRERGPRRAI